MNFQEIVKKGGPWDRAEIMGSSLLLQGDCLLCLPYLPKVDAVITDPIWPNASVFGRRSIGIEVEKKYFDLARERIDQAQRQGRMFA